MASMPTLRNIANETPASATDPDYNFEVIETHLANEVINRSGAVAMVGPLSLTGLPVADNHAASKGYVDALLPIAMMVDFGGDTAPAGWALCDGSARSSTDPLYSPLFAAIGFRFGDAGSGNFRLPDFRAKVSVGKGAPAGGYDTVGMTGGNATSGASHVHTYDVSHSHTSPAHTHTSGSHSHGYAHSHNIDPPSTSTNAAGNHNHSLAIGLLFGSFTPARQFDLHDGGGSFGVNDSNPVYSGDHAHTVDIAAFASGGSNSGDTTGGTAAGISSDAATVNSTTLSGSTGSVGVANGNYPPYLVVTKIIRL